MSSYTWDQLENWHLQYTPNWTPEKNYYVNKFPLVWFILFACFNVLLLSEIADVLVGSQLGIFWLLHYILLWEFLNNKIIVVNPFVAGLVYSSCLAPLRTWFESHFLYWDHRNLYLWLLVGLPTVELGVTLIAKLESWEFVCMILSMTTSLHLVLHLPLLLYVLLINFKSRDLIVVMWMISLIISQKSPTLDSAYWFWNLIFVGERRIPKTKRNCRDQQSRIYQKVDVRLNMVW